MTQLALSDRKEDIRATEKDKVHLSLLNLFFPAACSCLAKIVFLLQVEIYKSFRPGDIVLAKVVSLTCYRI